MGANLNAPRFRRAGASPQGLRRRGFAAGLHRRAGASPQGLRARTGKRCVLCSILLSPHIWRIRNSQNEICFNVLNKTFPSIRNIALTYFQQFVSAEHATLLESLAFTPQRMCLGDWSRSRAHGACNMNASQHVHCRDQVVVSGVISVVQNKLLNRAVTLQQYGKLREAARLVASLQCHRNDFDWTFLLRVCKGHDGTRCIFHKRQPQQAAEVRQFDHCLLCDPGPLQHTTILYLQHLFR